MAHTLQVYENVYLDQQTLNQIQTFVPGWFPPAQPGYHTICIILEGQINIFEVQIVVNLCTIIPRAMGNLYYLQTCINAILEWLTGKISSTYDIQVANEIRYKVAFYSPATWGSLSITSWAGRWRYSRRTMMSITGVSLGGNYLEYVCRLTFNPDWSIQNFTAQTFFSEKMEISQ